MKRVIAVLALVALVATSGTAALLWQLTRNHGPQLPEVSAYTNGNLVRVGPFLYCEVLNLNACQAPGIQGLLPVDDGHPIQLSVPAQVARAPWRLLQVYENPIDTTVSVFRPDSRLAVTIPTVDPQRGRITGIAVQLLTLVMTPDQQLLELPHAEWSIQAQWAAS